MASRISHDDARYYVFEARWQDDNWSRVPIHLIVGSRNWQDHQDRIERTKASDLRDFLALRSADVALEVWGELRARNEDMGLRLVMVQETVTQMVMVGPEAA